MSLFLRKLRIGRLTCWFFSPFSNRHCDSIVPFALSCNFRVGFVYIYETKLIIMNLGDWMLITSINKFRYNRNIV